MDKTITMTQLVREAGMGDKKSMEKLVTVTRPQLFAYLLRLTMDYHLAEDLLQQLQTEIVMSLWRLRKADRFWPWIYKHAWGLVQHHYRDTRKHKEVFLSEMEQSFFDEQFNTEKVEKDTFFESTDTKGLFETVYQAMKTISLKQRTVLTMHCFNDMTFAEIGDFLECSETNARVLFFRAKSRLKGKLRRKGYHTGKMFLPALALFGTITSKSASAATPATVVSGSSLQVGFAASLIGAMTSKLGILATSLLSAALGWLSLMHMAFLLAVTLLILPLLILLAFYLVYCE